LPILTIHPLTAPIDDFVYVFEEIQSRMDGFDSSWQKVERDILNQNDEQAADIYKFVVFIVVS